MRMINNIFTSLMRLCVVFVVVSGAHARTVQHPLLVISLDGFRFDYTSLARTPVLDNLRKNGASFDFMQPVFPTKTFPAHHSMATGLYPDTHGIVGNYMFDASTNKHFSPRHMSDDIWWREGEPIWITARRQGLKTGVCFWLSGEQEFAGGLTADLNLPFNRSVNKHQQIDAVVTWLTRDHADLVLLYFNEPDHTAHATGSAATSQSTRDAVEHVDKLIGHLFRKLNAAGMRNQVNIVVVSDHGMTEVSLDERVIELQDVISDDIIQDISDEGPLVNILPREGHVDEVFDKLKQLEKREPHMRVYHKRDLPVHLHFNSHPRIHPIVILAEEAWMVVKVNK